MDPDDFEHFIRQVFVKYASKLLRCSETDRLIVGKTTKVGTSAHSGDRGVDIVIKDPRPIIGQNIVVQAKCYTLPVGCEPVRALHTSVIEHKANKGILVTTSKFGPESRNIARRFGESVLELIDGNQLLGLMRDLDIEGHIDIDAARQNNQHLLVNRHKRRITSEGSSMGTTTKKKSSTRKIPAMASNSK